MDAPVFMVTHEVPEGWPRDDAPFTFVTEGVARAVELASEVAGDGLVGVAAADVVQQCINLGLLDEITVNLTPVLLGSGVRLFDHLSNVPVSLDDALVIEARV
jgi:dihydrofolate reductase